MAAGCWEGKEARPEPSSRFCRDDDSTGLPAAGSIRCPGERPGRAQLPLPAGIVFWAALAAGLIAQRNGLACVTSGCDEPSRRAARRRKAEAQIELREPSALEFGRRQPSRAVGRPVPSCQLEGESDTQELARRPGRAPPRRIGSVGSVGPLGRRQRPKQSGSPSHSDKSARREGRTKKPTSKQLT